MRLDIRVLFICYKKYAYIAMAIKCQDLKGVLANWNKKTTLGIALIAEPKTQDSVRVNV